MNELRKIEELELVIENTILLRFPPNGKVPSKEFTIRTLPDWISEDEWFLARRKLVESILEEIEDL